MAKRKLVLTIVGILAVPVVAYLALLVVGLGSIAISDGALMDSKPTFTKQGIVDGYNRERKLEGLQPLKENVLLDKSACAKSDDMAEHNYYDHGSPDGVTWQSFIDKSGYQWQKAGENLIVGATSNDDAINSWMQSKEHRDNILGDYQDIGVCYKGTKIVVHLGKKL